MPTRSHKRTPDPADWRHAILDRMRTLILEAAPGITEERKWRKPSNPDGALAWSHGGLVCTGELYKDKVKLTFAKGASLPDPKGLFNSPFAGSARRAIDIREGEAVSAAAFKALVKEAVRRNGLPVKPKTRTAAAKAEPVKLLSGGNPQIAKGDGDAPVQAYIAAAPGWKRGACQRLDALIVRAVPGVKKAVKWNTPFYGVEGQGWFMAYHIFTRYIKVTFFYGRQLRPMPPVESKDANARYVHVHEDGALDEPQFVAWVKQAAAMPGWSGH